HEGFDRRGTRRRARRGGRSLHHLRFSLRRFADLRDAARVCRRATRQRALFDVAASAADVAESAAVRRFRAGGAGRRAGAVLQTTSVAVTIFFRVSPVDVSKTRRRSRVMKSKWVVLATVALLFVFA